MPVTGQYEFVPYLSMPSAERAIQFYSSVFGVEPYNRLDMPDGRVMHCEFRVGNARFYLSDELVEHGGTPTPERLGGTSVSIHVYVDDCDKLMESMQAHGATVLLAADDMFWGERFGRVRDPFGHEWGIASVFREMTTAEIQDAAARILNDDPA